MTFFPYFFSEEKRGKVSFLPRSFQGSRKQAYRESDAGKNQNNVRKLHFDWQAINLYLKKKRFITTLHIVVQALVSKRYFVSLASPYAAQKIMTPENKEIMFWKQKKKKQRWKKVKDEWDVFERQHGNFAGRKNDVIPGKSEKLVRNLVLLLPKVRVKNILKKKLGIAATCFQK